MAEVEDLPPRVLVARGVSAPEQIVVGDPASADILVTISPDGEAVEHRRGLEVAYVDIDPPDCALVECMERIKRAWEETQPTDRQHLGHAAAGMFVFYWVSADLRKIPDLVYEGRSDAIRTAAEDYIEGGFGLERGPSIVLGVI